MNLIRNYSYYEKLGFKNLESWSESDLSQFLIWDFFNACQSTTAGKNIPDFLVQDYEFLAKAKNKNRDLLDFFDVFFIKLASILKFGRERKKILFQTSKCPYIISYTRKKYDVSLMVNQGKRDKLFIRKDFDGFINMVDLAKYVHQYLQERDTKYLYQLIEYVEEKLKRINPDYIVLSGDELPIDRAIVLVSKKLGITTIQIHSGVYMRPSKFPFEDKSSALPLISGSVVDYLLVWGKYFKDLYIDQKVKKEKDIYILGYPYLIPKYDEINPPKNIYTVCFLAQDYERYNKDFLQAKLETVKQISEICKKLGFKFIYRPHPWGEDKKMIAESLPGVEFTLEKEKINETFSRADIFISFSSTALIEAVMRQKIALQVMNFPIKLDNLEELGACNKSFKDFIQLENYLVKIANSSDLGEFKIKVNNNYIETGHNPGQRFLEIIEKIEKNID